MKKFTIIAVAALSIWLLPSQVMAASLIPVGQVIGLEVASDSVCVAEFDGKLGKCAKDAGLQVGDEILEIDGLPID